MPLYITLNLRNRVLFIWAAALAIVYERSELVQVLLLADINFFFVFTPAANNDLFLARDSDLLILEIYSLHIVGIWDVWARNRMRYRVRNRIRPIELLKVSLRVPARVLFTIVARAAGSIANQAVLTLSKVTHVQIRLVVTALLVNSLIEFLSHFIQWVIIIVKAAGYWSISD